MDPSNWNTSYYHPPAYDFPNHHHGHYTPPIPEPPANHPVFPDFSPENTENRPSWNFPPVPAAPPAPMPFAGGSSGISGISGDQPLVGYANFGRFDEETARNGPGKTVKNADFAWMKPKRQKDGSVKKQTTFSRYQTMELEKAYLMQNYLTPSTKKELSERLDITENQAKTWFQNRRMKEKKIQGSQRKSTDSSN